MTAQQALLLVRSKWLEERKGQPAKSEISEQYAKACEEFPAQMQTAHVLWAFELQKGTS
jgi:hypothetical protein